jgi:rhodanese-related sulfurtransferase
MFGWLHRGSNDTTNTLNTTPADILRRLSEGEKLLLLDVREPAEYREAHVPGSTLVPLGQLAYKLEELPRDLPIVAVCRSGNRSSVAVSLLQRAGFTQVENLQGGIIAWARSGGPTRSSK